jgi:large subunit ribosomal protein L15
VGRGRGNGRGKTCTKGHKGQGQRKGLRKRGFAGGASPFWRRIPKLGTPTSARYWHMLHPLSLRRVLDFIQHGRIDASQIITMKTLYDSGCIPRVEWGVKLLRGGVTSDMLREALRGAPLHMQVSDTSSLARECVEGAEGSVHLIWFNRVTLRAHLAPLKFLRRHGRLPGHTGVPPPKLAAKYGFHVEHAEY